MGMDALPLKNLSEKDQKMIRDIEAMMGPEPGDMGFAKNLFWGLFRSDLVSAYPRVPVEEQRSCDVLLSSLEAYLKTDHPAMEIDRDQNIPGWVVQRLFDMGVMGCSLPTAYGGLGFGITSYNRVLEMLGAYCASTAVMVSAHQSIGCKALMLFGSQEQKDRFLPGLARHYLSAFCLSEPQVGSDAAGQETSCVVSEDGSHYILNGEKKWGTSGALSGLFMVMAQLRGSDPEKVGKRAGITALICTPDMEGLEIIESNRSKTGIRGTWQARLRFTDVRVPRENLLYQEGRGLHVALTCLNIGRCTLSAGITGAAKQAADQATKWARTRHQFGRPISDFELVQQRIARMYATTYAMEAVLYLMTGMLDRGDKDIMVETAITKVFCSQVGWDVIDDAMQIMGGEAFMTENELERSWRDNRIHRIVEGANEVMQPFIFGYGGKQLAEQMLKIQEALIWNAEESAGANLRRIGLNLMRPRVIGQAIPLAMYLFAGYRPGAPEVKVVNTELSSHAARLARLVRDHAHWFKMASKWYKEEIVTRQAVQARLGDSAMYLFVLSAILSRHDAALSRPDENIDRDRAFFTHAFDLFEQRILSLFRELRVNADATMTEAARAGIARADALPNADYYIHESSPTDAGTGKPVRTDFVPQFPTDPLPGGSMGPATPAGVSAASLKTG